MSDAKNTTSERMWWLKKRWLVAGTILVAVFPGYLLSYLVLSRQGYAEADRFNADGFYYFTPEPTDSWWWKNYGCMYVFMPLNVADRMLGFGRHSAKPPLWSLH